MQRAEAGKSKLRFVPGYQRAPRSGLLPEHIKKIQQARFTLLSVRWIQFCQQDRVAGVHYATWRESARQKGDAMSDTGLVGYHAPLPHGCGLEGANGDRKRVVPIIWPPDAAQVDQALGWITPGEKPVTTPDDREPLAEVLAWFACGRYDTAVKLRVLVVLRLVRPGMSLRSIGETCGCSKSRVGAVLREFRTRFSIRSAQFRSAEGCGHMRQAARASWAKRKGVAQ